MPGLGTATTIFGMLLQVFQDLKLRDKWIVKRIADNKAIKEEEVYLLDKLNPVARIE